MSTNGQLVFTDVDKITFKGVGNASNAVIDTLTGKIGVGVDSPDANLHVVGNSYVSTNLELGGTLIMGTVNVEAQHSLEAVTATGNTTPLTIEFTNPTTSLVASGNVEVDGNVVAGYLYGDGSNISGISGISSASNLQVVSDTGNVTSNTVQFTNATTSLVASGNVEVGGNVVAGYLYGDGSNITGISSGSNLQVVTDTGNVTSNTVQFSNATTGLVTTANVEVGGDLTVSGNVTVNENFTVSGSIPGYATKISVTSPSGTETSFAYGSENYKLHTFTSNGTFTVTASGIVEYLIVAGGGGGGDGDMTGGGHGGGGGGGVLTGTMWVPVGNHTVTVGGGGNAGIGSNTLIQPGTGGNGGNSIFLHQIAIGGGGGHGGSNVPLTGKSGGCGGGGGGYSGNGGGPGGYGIMNQGCNGGDGYYDDGTNNNASGHRGGGGGGAGTPGRSGNLNLHKNNWKAFEGGDGRACSITGSQVYYGGGGGGSGIVSGFNNAIVPASGGLGGGGNGGISNAGGSSATGNTAGGNGTANMGGGGGGGGYRQNGGAGGSGIVIIRYLS